MARTRALSSEIRTGICWTCSINQPDPHPGSLSVCPSMAARDLCVGREGERGEEKSLSLGEPVETALAA